MKPLPSDHPTINHNCNVPNVLRTIDLLEQLPDDRFDMGSFSYYVPDCGTVGCIAGHIIESLMEQPIAEMPLLISETRVAGEFLGLDGERARTLFMSHMGRSSIAKLQVTRLDAIEALKHLARTGEVDWSPVVNRAKEKEK